MPRRLSTVTLGTVACWSTRSMTTTRFPNPNRVSVSMSTRVDGATMPNGAYSELADGDPIVLDSGTDTEAGERAAANFLAMTDRPTAIVAANDMAAFALISALAAQGLSIPTDVSVVGFDGLALGGRFNPVLTTVRQPIADMGNIAIDLAEKKAAEGSVDHVVLTPELLVRASTAGPPA